MLGIKKLFRVIEITKAITKAIKKAITKTVTKGITKALEKAITKAIKVVRNQKRVSHFAIPSDFSFAETNEISLTSTFS